MDDCLIVGGGVVGLSLAYELSGHGINVRIIERGEVGREASWAGAGILPAAILRSGDVAYDQLSGLSHQLHPQWAEQLRAETGIDTGFRRCGEIYVARNARDAEDLRPQMQSLTERGITVEQLTLDQLDEREPALAVKNAKDGMFYHVPATAQLRNPRHLKALDAACRRRGVQVVERAEVLGLDVQDGRVQSVNTCSGEFRAETYCMTAGAWSGQLLQKLSCRTSIKPMRGQMVLLKADKPLLQSVVCEGPYYLVPRDDGHVLAGATVEDVGFDKRTSASAVRDLLQFAASLVPLLADADVVRCWAGLRPGSLEGQPYIGKVPDLDNLFVASGHFRWGLYLSPATAVVLTELIRGRPPRIDLAEFQPGRD